MTEGFLKTILVAMVLVLVVGPASATSWFKTTNKASKSVSVQNYPVADDRDAQEEYHAHSALVVVNPGGWGSPTDIASMSEEDMNYLAKVMQHESNLIAEIKAEEEQSRIEQARIQAQRAVLEKQGISNSIDPLGTQAEAPLVRTKSDRGAVRVPKVPVAEWEKMNRDSTGP